MPTKSALAVATGGRNAVFMAMPMGYTLGRLMAKA
jgi:hypothetical protein